MFQQTTSTSSPLLTNSIKPGIPSLASSDTACCCIETCTGITQQVSATSQGQEKTKTQRCKIKSTNEYKPDAVSQNSEREYSCWTLKVDCKTGYNNQETDTPSCISKESKTETVSKTNYGKQFRKSCLKSQVVELQSLVSDHQEEIHRLLHQINHLSHNDFTTIPDDKIIDDDISKFVQRINADIYIQETGDLKTQIKVIVNKLENVNFERRQLQTVCNWMKRLSELKEEQLKAAEKDGVYQIQALKTLNEELLRQKNELLVQVEETNNIRRKTKDEASILEQKVLESEEKYEKLKSQINVILQMVEKLKEKEKDYEELKISIECINRLRCKAEESAAIAENNVKEKEKRLSFLQNEMKNLYYTISKIKEERKDYDDLKAAFERLSKERDILKSEIISKIVEANKAQSAIAVINFENKILERRIGELEDQNGGLKKYYNDSLSQIPGSTSKEPCISIDDSSAHNHKKKRLAYAIIE